MIVLFLDTCTKYLNIGIVKDDNLLYAYQDNSSNQHSKNTIIELEKAFKETNILPEDINKIIVTNGPGYYTGIRVGVTIAKTYAWSKKIELIPADTLKCIALSSTKVPNYMTFIDAKRDYYFAALYDENYKEIINKQYISKENIFKLLENKTYSENDDNTKLDILKIVKYYENKESINPHKLNPVYLKQTEAEENL